MVTYQPDSPSRMCDGWLDEAARMVIDRVGFKCHISLRPRMRICMPLQQPYPRVDTHIDATAGLVWRTVLRPHTSASSVLPSPLLTRMSMHHLTPSHIPHIPSLLLDVQRLRSGLSQASGMGHQAGLVLSSRTPIRM
jgi:hypothetical protein